MNGNIIYNIGILFWSNIRHTCITTAMKSFCEVVLLKREAWRGQGKASFLNRTWRRRFFSYKSTSGRHMIGIQPSCPIDFRYRVRTWPFPVDYQRESTPPPVILLEMDRHSHTNVVRDYTIKYLTQDYQVYLYVNLYRNVLTHSVYEHVYIFTYIQLLYNIWRYRY